ncbi:MAG TPA: hypothetical protein VGQ65_14760 [Thermoanaerobaculia bacterium]|nr:hypothetical protein [Thermoanaerobaculia bacterium]
MAGPPYTWNKDIKQLFNSVDIEHMGEQGLDLASYATVSKRANGILRRLKDPDDPMPPPEDGGPWPADKIAKFEWWAKNGTPE